MNENADEFTDIIVMHRISIRQYLQWLEYILMSVESIKEPYLPVSMCHQEGCRRGFRCGQDLFFNWKRGYHSGDVGQLFRSDKLSLHLKRADEVDQSKAEFWCFEKLCSSQTFRSIRYSCTFLQQMTMYFYFVELSATTLAVQYITYCMKS